MKFIKENLFSITIGLLFLVIALVLLKTCQNTEKVIESKTIIKHDTTYIQGAVIKVPEYFPVKDTVYLDTTRIPKPSTELAELTKQYKDLANKHYSDVKYKDSVKLMDSAYLGKDLGTVYIDDLVTENELKTRNIRYQLKFPQVTTTITTTNTVQAKAKNQVYIGAQVTGNQTDFINGLNAIVLLKNKKDVIYGITAGGQILNNNIKPQFGITILKKIKL